MSDSYNSAPSEEGETRTITKDASESVGGSAVLEVWPLACRAASISVRVSSAAPALYVYLFDTSGDAAPSGANAKLIERSDLVPAGSAGRVEFREEGTPDAEEGGYPFDRGCFVIATPNPEFDVADIFPDPYLDTLTARVQISPRRKPCDPLQAMRPVVESLGRVSQQLQIVATAQQNAQAAGAPPAQPQYTMQQGPTRNRY
jgi:hypothetical protein